jgi:hypothetical protein
MQMDEKFREQLENCLCNADEIMDLQDGFPECISYP